MVRVNARLYVYVCSVNCQCSMYQTRRTCRHEKMKDDGKTLYGENDDASKNEE